MWGGVTWPPCYMQFQIGKIVTIRHMTFSEIFVTQTEYKYCIWLSCLIVFTPYVVSSWSRQIKEYNMKIFVIKHSHASLNDRDMFWDALLGDFVVVWISHHMNIPSWYRLPYSPGYVVYPICSLWDQHLYMRTIIEQRSLWSVWLYLLKNEFLFGNTLTYTYICSHRWTRFPSIRQYFRRCPDPEC